MVHALTPAGKIYAEFTLTGMAGGRFMVVTGAAVEGHDLRHMSEVAWKGRFDVTIDNITDDLNVLREVSGFLCFPLPFQLLDEIATQITRVRLINFL